MVNKNWLTLAAVREQDGETVDQILAAVARHFNISTVRLLTPPPWLRGGVSPEVRNIRAARSVAMYVLFELTPVTKAGIAQLFHCSAAHATDLINEIIRADEWMSAWKRYSDNPFLREHVQELDNLRSASKAVMESVTTESRYGAIRDR
jgi:chromosomal replication initiation ATPase DnaA